MRRLACALVVCLVAVVGLPPTDAAAADRAYTAPVGGPVIDPFRPPATPYGPGNRGVDYTTAPGDPVRAAADGEVVFAGNVGRSRHVVVLHPDGIRTSYSFLASVALRRGDRVRRGDVVGVAGARLHFGARLGDDHYLDPLALLRGEPPAVHLVPVHERRAEPERRERFHLLRSLIGTSVRVSAAGVSWARDEVAASVGAAVDGVADQLASLEALLEVVEHYSEFDDRLFDVGRRMWSIHRSQQGCTPASTSPRPRPPGRRIAVLVGGFGSRSGHAAVLDVDTRALGYADTDVAQFSYRGGQAPGPRRLEGIPVSSYGAADSEGDIRAAGERLRQLLQAIRVRHPGVPVDLIAHSQGGLVVRSGLGADGDRHDPRLPPVDHVITLGTPHHGTESATLNQALGTSGPGELLQVGIRELSGGTDPLSTAAGQMSQTSDFVADLEDRPLPADADVTSISARGDLTVPALSAELPGATNAMVRIDGPSAHDRLPGSPEAHREMALALAGQGPTCRNVVGDVATAAAVGFAEDIVGGVLTGATLLSRAPRR